MSARALDAGLRYRPRVRAGASTDEIVAHFDRRFGLDVRHADPETGRAPVGGARPLAWAEAQPLDQLLRQVPARFVRDNPALAGFVLVDRNAIGRKGGYRPPERRIVIYRPGQSLMLPDEVIPTCSMFVATAAHELGEAAWEGVLTDKQRGHYAAAIASEEHSRAAEDFADLLMKATLAPEIVTAIDERAFLRALGIRL